MFIQMTNGVCKQSIVKAFLDAQLLFLTGKLSHSEQRGDQLDLDVQKLKQDICTLKKEVILASKYCFCITFMIIFCSSPNVLSKVYFITFKRGHSSCLIYDHV